MTQREIINNQINFTPKNCLNQKQVHNDWKGRIVLRKVDGAHPYVTHYFNGECGGYHGGHSFETYEQALNDFNGRNT